MLVGHRSPPIVTPRYHASPSSPRLAKQVDWSLPREAEGPHVDVRVSAAALAALEAATQQALECTSLLPPEFFNEVMYGKEAPARVKAQGTWRSDALRSTAATHGSAEAAHAPGAAPPTPALPPAAATPPTVSPAAVSELGGDDRAGMVILQIEGLHCGGCVGGVEGALRSVGGVLEVHVVLEEELAYVWGSAEGKQLIAAVEATGKGATRVPAPIATPVASAAGPVSEGLQGGREVGAATVGSEREELLRLRQRVAQLEATLSVVRSAVR